MAYGFKQGLDSFWHVKHKYDNTKPMVSKNHAKQDNLRPAGRNRSRKWEHIRKLSETCYAICDGQNGDPIFSASWGGNAAPTVPIEDTYNLSPIVWEIMEQPDGSYLETIKIRNGTGDFPHTSRYSFLHEFLPDNMRLIVGQNGKQYVGVGKDYYLPKSKSLDEQRWNNYHTRHKTTYGLQREDDQKYLKFGRTTLVSNFTQHLKRVQQKSSGTRTLTVFGDGPPIAQEFVSSDWKLISPEFQPVNPTSKVDKERKRKLKPYINEFWDWALAVGGTLHASDRMHVRECLGVLREHRVVTSSWFASNVTFDPSSVQKILKEPQNELRVQLLTVFLNKWNVRQAIRQDDRKKLRAAYNAWINNACGLVTKTKGK